MTDDLTNGHPILALWCHPRSMSTAIERIMRERGDCQCRHEPFMYDYYVARAVRDMPRFERDPDQPVEYAAIRDQLRAEAGRGPVFIKDMSYYVAPEIVHDPLLAPQLRDAFLIRDPRRSIASYWKLDAEVTLEEIGLEAQARHVAALERRDGRTPFILEAEAAQHDPKGAITALWRAYRLPPAPHAFDWSEEATPAEWGAVSGWHESVMSSSGIRAAKDDDAEAVFERAAAQAPHLRGYLAHHWPHYQFLRERAHQAEP